ncbi:MAG: phenylalanine--tRNA ligase subunit beta [Gracilibacteraceae bacterium]|jgi:phenylalanyl-tRNA synthetase beta chain|nr:phenylalanine--tRNA ligase subunit beta [Gracilibacteraceae bacterium]
MLVPVKWLKDYVDIKFDPKGFADAMTMSGSKVEGIEELGKEIDNVLVGKILKTEKHPNADKLIVAQCDVGNEVIQIVTGATNIKEGDYIPIAKHGSSLPGGVKIKKGKLRGIESNGMMCSAQELALNLEGLPEDMLDGIYILDGKYPLGADIKDVLGLNDAVVEFEITNNRPDCLSIIGIAREAAATFGVVLKYPKADFKENNENIKDYIDIRVENSELCPRYMARMIKNIVIKDSPAWMQERLIKAGVRPINNIVDITNFVMLELGQPMHAFDYRDLEGKKIIVRNAKPGEKILTLDETERKLDESMLVIADGEKPTGIAGVMGGYGSEIKDDTTAIIFESANFNPVNIRLTSKKLGLRTEASSRYEKGIDPELAEKALNRACSLVEQLGAGEVVGGSIDIYPTPVKPRKLSLNIKKVNDFIGVRDITGEMAMKYLTSLEFGAEMAEEGLEVTVPTFRNDVEGEADLIEEIARLYGYEKIPAKLMDTTFTQGGKDNRQKIRDLAKANMAAQGLYEVVTYTFVSPAVYNKISLKAENPLRNAIKILNPLGEDQSIMRTTLIPNMLEVISRNYNMKIAEGKFFELSKVYLADELTVEKLAEERETLAIGMYGNVDFFDLKGVVENLMDELHVDKYRILPSNNDSMHPGRTAELLLNNRRVGFLGEVHPEVLDKYDIPARVYIAEFNFEEILLQCNMNIKYKILPKYPSVARDIAIVVAEEITAGQLEETIRNKGGRLVEDVKLFDIYRGSQIKEGYKSMAYSIVYRSDEKTLSEEDITRVHNKIVNSLINQLGAELRQ